MPIYKGKMFFGTPFASVPWGMIQSTMGYLTVDYIGLRNELEEKLQAAEIDHGNQLSDISAIRNMVALRLIF
jgi:hypothetical protein